MRFWQRASPAAANTALAQARALLQERQRIYQNLHDDLGAKLLDLVYGAESPQQADRAREALHILRDVVSQSARPPGPLSAALDAVHAEAMDRLNAASVALAWQQADDMPDPMLDQAQVLHLARIVREAISNALRHSGTQALRIRVSHLVDELVLDVTDFGHYAPQAIGEGQGTRNMREHAAGLSGHIVWDEATQGGTKVLLRVPLPAA
ncbi:MAG: ATP-binding protein [Stagnimonas sp.]|nr:ATP-binding protein [Stagnimonas sp.]